MVRPGVELPTLGRWSERTVACRFRINIARRVIRGVKKADQKLYWDDWWNGRETGNPNFELAPSEALRIDMYDLNRVDVMLLTQMRYWDLNHKHDYDHKDDDK